MTGSHCAGWSRPRARGLAWPLVGLSWLSAATACARPVATDEEKAARVAEMVADIAEAFPGVESISVAEAGRLLEKDSIVLIDARDPAERAVSMIPGSIAAAEFEADPGRYADVAAVAYCTIGYRSSRYAARLTAEGIPVRNLGGSILAWTHEGGPLVGPDGPTTRLHVYGETWDLAPGRYETIW
ncbi:MAG: rhodanese-like domain-containing protein [Gemmatimonadota bacterium]|nr:rhodanese-like domain-containing protein [Gemmatimonadota bacterium]